MPATRFDPMHMTAIGEVAVGSGVPPGVTENNSARIKRMNLLLLLNFKPLGVQ